MNGDNSISQAALVVIATAVSIQSLLMLVGAWLAVRAWRETQATLERHANLLHARVDVLSDAARYLVETIDDGAARVSSMFTTGERVAGAMASMVATPKVVLLAQLAGKVVSKWRGRTPRPQLPRY